MATAAPPRPTGREMVRRLEDELGEEKQIRLIQPNWDQFRRENIVVKLSCRWYRAVQTLNISDLGLDNADEEFQEFARDYLTLGTQRLLPTEVLKEMKSIEEGARQQVRKFGFRSPWGGYAVPVRAWPALRAELEARRDRFQALAQKILDNYEDLVAEVADAYRKKARTRYAMSQGWIRVDLCASTPEDAAIEKEVAAILAMIPPKETLEQSYSFEWELGYVERPRVLDPELDVDDLERQAQELREIIQAHEAERQRRSQLLQEDAEFAEYRREQERRRAELADLEERMKLRRELDAEISRTAATAQQRYIEEALGNVSARILSLIQDASAEIAAAVRDKQKIHPRQVERIRNTVEMVRTLDFTDNADLRRLADHLSALTEIAPESREADRFLRDLGDVEAITRAELFTLQRGARVELDVAAVEPVPLARLNEARRNVFTTPEAVPTLPLTRTTRSL